MDVSVLLEPTIDLDRLAAALDGLGHEGRVHTTRGWATKQQRALFAAARGRPIALDFLVPPSVAPLTEVIHDGHNTLPLFSRFRKRFVKLEGEAVAVAGYNDNVGLAALPGPGYFVVRPGDGEHEGELVIDYTELPRQKPERWPEVRENRGLLASVVYGGMVDYLRPLSAHVSIGRAFRRGKPSENYFAMVRRDPG